MATVQNQEDLEARIARIKKRNEELEKKHREAEEDRLRAMKENAMVEIRASKHDDWPREHKYDKIEFNYDLDPEALAQLEEKKKEKDAFIQKIAKEYKVFAEGEGPPPDPAYSFLADVERDGEKAAAANAAAAAAGNGSHAPSTNGTRSPPSRGDNFDRRNPHNRSGHRHQQGGGGGGGGRGRGGGSGKSHPGNTVQRSYSTNEHDGWRSASGEQHRKSQGSQEGGLWRRETGGAEAPPRAPKEDAANLTASVKLEPNLRVSVSRDGEFKSVKVTSPPIIGSGRVGPRHPGKPQFQFHAGQGDGQPPHGKQLPLTRRQGESSGDQFNRNAPARKSDRGTESTKRSAGGHSKSHAASATHNNNGNNTNGGAGNLQDRLNRNRQSSGSDKNDNHLKPAAQQPAAVATESAKATLKTISKIIEKNAAIDEQLLRENEKLVTSKVKELRLQQQAE